MLFHFAEILLFNQPPSGDYEYINPRKYARNETALHSDDELGCCGDASGDSDDTYDKISPSGFARSQPTAPPKRFAHQPTKPVAPNVPVKWRSSENDGRQNIKVIEEHVTTKSRPERPNVIREKTKEPATSSSSTIGTLAGKQAAQTGDDMLYEVIDPPTNINVTAAGEMYELVDSHANISSKTGETTKPKQNIEKSSKTSQPKHQLNQQYSVPHICTQPGKKPPPPPTKPKTVKWNQNVASQDTQSNCPTTVCRVNPVKPVVDRRISLPVQSSTSTGHGKKPWKTARDLPAALEDLSVEEVGECMELLHLPELAAAFKSQDVDGKLLVSIVSEEVLTMDFNCRVFDAKKVVMFVKNGWRPAE